MEHVARCDSLLAKIDAIDASIKRVPYSLVTIEVERAILQQKLDRECQQWLKSVRI